MREERGVKGREREGKSIEEENERDKMAERQRGNGEI